MHEHPLSRSQIVSSRGNYPVGVLTRKFKNILVPCSFSLKTYRQRDADFKEKKMSKYWQHPHAEGAIQTK